MRRVLGSLVESRILRTDEGGRYEIFHDVLAGAVLGWTSRFHSEQAWRWSGVAGVALWRWPRSRSQRSG